MPVRYSPWLWKAGVLSQNGILWLQQWWPRWSVRALLRNLQVLYSHFEPSRSNCCFANTASFALRCNDWTKFWWWLANKVLVKFLFILSFGVPETCRIRLKLVENLFVSTPHLSSVIERKFSTNITLAEAKHEFMMSRARAFEAALLNTWRVVASQSFLSKNMCWSFTRTCRRALGYSSRCLQSLFCRRAFIPGQHFCPLPLNDSHNWWKAQGSFLSYSSELGSCLECAGVQGYRELYQRLFLVWWRWWQYISSLRYVWVE